MTSHGLGGLAYIVLLGLLMIALVIAVNVTTPKTRDGPEVVHGEMCIDGDWAESAIDATQLLCLGGQWFEVQRP